MFIADTTTSNHKLSSMTTADHHHHNIGGVDKKRTVRHDYHDHANEAPLNGGGCGGVPASISDTSLNTRNHAGATTISVISASPTVPLRTQQQVQQQKQQQQQQQELIDEAEEEANKKRRGPRGGVAVPFPEKLHLMLSSVEQDGNSHIVSWQMHGRCFVVHKPKEFVSLVMPTYFRQTKLTSFQRQLNLYGFCRLTSGRDRGGYYHELFLRGKPFLCKRMMRTRIKGTGIKAASSPQTEPDFYSMPSVKDFSQSSSSLKDYNGTTSFPQQQQPTMTQQHQQHQVAHVTPPAAQVTPIHMPTAAPPELPMDMFLAPYDEQAPPSNSLIQFEGQQFHYLDPSTLLNGGPSDAIQSYHQEYPLNDIVMV